MAQGHPVTFKVNQDLKQIFSVLVQQTGFPHYGKWKQFLLKKLNVNYYIKFEIIQMIK